MTSAWRLVTLAACAAMFLFAGLQIACLEEGDADADADGDGDGDAVIGHGACAIVEDDVAPPEGPERPDAVDYLVLTADHLAEAAREHAAWRDERGHRSEVLTMSEVLDTGGGVTEDVDEAIGLMREAIAARRDALEEDRELFVLLVGDANRSWSGQVMEVPPAEVSGWSWEEADWVTSDNVIADLDDDDLPDVAIGRIPATKNAQVAEVLRRTRALEEAPYQPGPANYRVPIFASEAGFGDVVDEMIEIAGFAAVREVPADWELTFTYARPGSPYAYPPALFSDRVYDLLNEGSLMTVYIGHGYTGGFDSVRWGDESAPILDTNDLDRLEMERRPTLLVLSACLTGAFDTGTSVVEEFLQQNDGPTAVIASTEISHPYANGVLLRELAMVTLTDRVATTGEAFMRARRRMIEAADDPIRVELEGYAAIDPTSATPELRENLLLAHEHMYVLFGDPAHRLRYPQGVAEIALGADEVEAGDEIDACIQIHGPPEGDVVVTLETDRETIGVNLEPWEMDDPDRDQVVAENNARANEKAFERIEGRYAGGGLHVSFPSSNEHTGTLTIRVYAFEGDRDALGSTTVRVRRAE